MILRCTLAVALALCATPAAAVADLTLHAPTLLAMADPAGATTAGPAAGSLDFDLLGAAPQSAPSAQAAAESRLLQRRRTLLNWHQGIGLALVGAEVGTTVLGQLNYQDKFAGSAPANTNRYRLPHAAFAISTLGLFATNGILALLAPDPPGRTLKLDRVMVHRISMALATAGMIAQAYYGFHTSGREGYLDQASIARTHLAIGYATLAAFTVGVGAITF